MKDNKKSEPETLLDRIITLIDKMANHDYSPALDSTDLGEIKNLIRTYGNSYHLSRIEQWQLERKISVAQEETKNDR